MAEKVAATGTGLAGFMAGAAWVAEVEPYLTALAAFVAIVSGVAATWYHIERGKYMHRKNEEAKGGGVRDKEPPPEKH